MDAQRFKDELNAAQAEEIRERYFTAIKAYDEAAGIVYRGMNPYQFEAYRAWKLAGCDVGRAKDLLNLRQIAQKGVSDRRRRSEGGGTDGQQALR